jgi:hypothetical protein
MHLFAVRSFPGVSGFETSGWKRKAIGNHHGPGSKYSSQTGVLSMICISGRFVPPHTHKKRKIKIIKNVTRKRKAPWI